MSSNKEIKKVLRFYPCCLYFLLEKWLKQMSLSGWHLIERKSFIYCFEKGKPQNREYFAWDPTATGMGKYSIPMRYPFLIKTYGKHKKKSQLNRNSLQKGDTIMEVDTERIDVSSDVGYKELVSERNRLYSLMTLEFCGLILLCLALIIIIFCAHRC